MYPSVCDDLIFDVGLHKGEDAAFYLRKGFRVVGIDANPELIEKTRQRFNGDPRIKIINGAIERGKGTVTFYMDASSVWGTTDPQWAERNRHLGSSQTELTVPILDIRSIFEERGVPYYLKLDIEGRERVFLSAMFGLTEKPPFLSMESEKVSFRKLVGDLRTLRALGYRRFQIVQQKHIPDSTIKTVDRQGNAISHTFEPDASGPFGDDLPGRWMSFAETVTRYVPIFIGYKLFGDRGLAFRVRGGSRVYSLLLRIIGHFPGWHDVHARRE